MTEPPGIERVLFTEEQVDQRIREVAAEISAKYQGRDLKLIAVLKGAVFFLTALARAIEIPLKIDFLAISSFGSGGPGMVRIAKDLDHPIQDEDILLVEDIVDTGRTLNRLMDLLRARNPRSLEICALLHKHIAEELKYDTKFVGFDAPHEFLVGYGLDHAESFRHIPYIASLL